MLEVKNVACFIGNKALLHDITLSFSAGRIYGILGPNGSGKTTLLKIINKLCIPSQGSVIINGENLVELCRRDISKLIAYVQQNPVSTFDYTVEEIVEMGSYAGTGSVSKNSKSTLARIVEALKSVDAMHLQKRNLQTLSGGEKQRVYIARALMADTPIILLDEPTASLDIEQQLQVWHILSKLKQAGKLIILAVHDINSAEQHCDELVLLNNGRCIDHGEVKKLKLEQFLEETYGVMTHPDYSFKSFLFRS